MATRAELEILITARDDASAQLKAAVTALEAMRRASATPGKGWAAADARDARRAYAEASKSAREYTTTLNKEVRTSTRNARQDFAAMFATLSSNGSLLGNFRMANMLASLSIGALGIAAIGFGMELDSLREQATLAFTTMEKTGLGALGVYNTLTKDTSAAAAATAMFVQAFKDGPYVIGATLTAAKNLVTGGFGPDAAKQLLGGIQNALASVGNFSDQTMTNVAGDFSAMKQTGVFSMSAVNDLMSAGVPIVAALAKQFHTTDFAVTAMLNRLSGKVPADFWITQIQAALQNFSDGSTDAMTTFQGKLVGIRNNFQDIMSQLTGGSGASIFNTASGALGGLNDMLSKVSNSLNSLGDSGVGGTVKSIAGWGLALASIGTGLSSGSEGLGAIGSLLGSGGGGGGGGSMAIMLAIVVAIIALIALLTPWAALFEAMKKALEDIRDKGSGGGGGPPSVGTLLPVEVAGVIKLNQEQAQADVDAWQNLLIKIGFRLPILPDVQSQVNNEYPDESIKGSLAWIIPSSTQVQNNVDSAYASGSLRAILNWYIPADKDVQSGIDSAYASGLLRASLGWIIPSSLDVQDSINFAYTNIRALLYWNIPSSDDMQNSINFAYTTLRSMLNWNIPSSTDVQSSIDSVYTTLRSMLNWWIPTEEAVQSSINSAYTTLRVMLNWWIPNKDSVQSDVTTAYPDGAIRSMLKWWIPGSDEVQQGVNAAYPDGSLRGMLKWWIPNSGEMQSGIDNAYPDGSLRTPVDFQLPSIPAFQDIINKDFGGNGTPPIKFPVTIVGTGVVVGTGVGTGVGGTGGTGGTGGGTGGSGSGSGGNGDVQALYRELKARGYGDGDISWLSSQLSSKNYSPTASDISSAISIADIQKMQKAWDIQRVAHELHVPGYADGGIVTRPTFAMVGERGPEAIIPLSRSNRMGSEQHFHLHLGANTILAGTDVDSWLSDRVDELRRRGKSEVPA